MTGTRFIWTVRLLGIGFAVAFAVIVIPALVRDGDLLGGFADGFVNPYSTGYSLDVFFCWAVLAAWVAWERHEFGVRRGWIALAVGVIPGVATGFALYLLMRRGQVRTEQQSPADLVPLTPGPL